MAQGCTRRYSPDYEETFSPVVRFKSVRALGARQGLQLHQMDVATESSMRKCIWSDPGGGGVEEGKEGLYVDSSAAYTVLNNRHGVGIMLCKR